VRFSGTRARITTSQYFAEKEKRCSRRFGKCGSLRPKYNVFSIATWRETCAALFKTMRVLAAVIVGLFALSFQCRASSIPTYAETGAFILIGNNVCGGPCTEVVSFSFDVTFVAGAATNLPNLYVAQIIPGTFSYTATGPLNIPVSCGCISFEDPYSAYQPYIFFASNQIGYPEELDMRLLGASSPISAGTPGPLQFKDAYLFQCWDTTCLADFAYLNGVTIGPFAYTATGYMNATLVPEPSVLEQLLIGILALAFLCRTRYSNLGKLESRTQKAFLP
jgi:hypothetical protein